MNFLPWIAVALLPMSYWLQVYRIAKHKEVRDLSLPSYLMMAVGFSLLGYEAWDTGSTIFLVKQLMVIVPVVITAALIIKHRKSEWHDDSDRFCVCGNELESHWKHCADCGLPITLSKGVENENDVFSGSTNASQLCDNQGNSRKTGRRKLRRHTSSNC